MKKIILAISVFSIGLVSTTKAQDDLREKFMIGFKAGLNLSNVYDTQGQDFRADNKVGVAAGGFLSIPIGKFLGFQPELLYSQRGFSGTGTSVTGPYDFTRTNHFIDVPLLLQIKPIQELAIVIGPQYSFLAKQTDVFNSNTSTTVREQDFNNDNITRNLFCFTTGVDLNFGHLTFGGRAGWDVQNNRGDGTSNTPRYKNVWYQATIGFRIY